MSCPELPKLGELNAFSFKNTSSRHIVEKLELNDFEKKENNFTAIFEPVYFRFRLLKIKRHVSVSYGGLEIKI